MPTTAAGLRVLKRLGTAQNVKLYRRHGAGEDVYGVSFADLCLVGNRLARNHAAAPSIERPLARTKTAATT